jgi:hypothetical protein
MVISALRESTAGTGSSHAQTANIEKTRDSVRSSPHRADRREVEPEHVAHLSNLARSVFAVSSSRESPSTARKSNFGGVTLEIWSGGTTSGPLFTKKTGSTP